jgi:SNF2 family DNA or RNA helicase
VGNDAVSGKTETLFELLDPLLADGQKVLVFSQFVQVLKLLELECQRRQIRTHLLTGQTKQRQEVVNAFQNDPNAAVFLLSLRAAGTGLNLTNASYVVLYDPWWNPAVEAQATDRAHRIGQTKPVFVYKLIAQGTVEERMLQLQSDKRVLAGSLYTDKSASPTAIGAADLELLFAP